MSWLDTIKEAAPTWLGGTGGNLTANDQSELVRAEQGQIGSVVDNAEYYYGSLSDTADTARKIAVANEAYASGDVNSVDTINEKANQECSLLSVVNGQAQFQVCYPQAKWYALAAGVVLLLWLLAPYVTVLSGLRRRA